MNVNNLITNIHNTTFDYHVNTLTGGAGVLQQAVIQLPPHTTHFVRLPTHSSTEKKSLLCA